VLYLLRGLLNVVYEINWDKNSDTKVHVFMMVIVMLSAAAQGSYIYHIDKGFNNYMAKSTLTNIECWFNFQWIPMT
jgi:hypothetical protein